jgi:phosphoglycolate phosphatase
MKYRLAIFDFDGTLADSFPFFLSVFNQLAEQHGFKQIEPESASQFRHYTPKQMMEKLEMPAWKLPLVAKNFIGLMRQNAASIKRFEHVDATLAHLANHGVTLAIVTSNSYDNASQILGPENTKLFSQFECGMSIFGKPARIKKVLKKTGIPAAEAIYVGDQITDLEAAHQANVAFGAVSWGYGSIESMRALNPEEEFDTVSDLQRIA